VALIDVARGLFPFWMLTAHALSLAGVRESSVLAVLIPPSGMQAQALALVGRVDPETAGGVLTVVTVGLILATCAIRESHGGLSTALKRVGLYSHPTPAHHTTSPPAQSGRR